MAQLELPTIQILEGSREVSADGQETFAAVSTCAATEGAKGKVYIETYGCQMNVSDSEIVASILHKDGYSTTDRPEEADVILLNTCAIREHAELKIHHRLESLKPYKRRKPKLVIGVLGCMAERMKAKLFEEEKIVDLIAGPDAYRSLPQLIELAETGQKAANVFLSLEETYADITPVRRAGISAFVSIMRGCDNMCSFCVVPFTRGRERSRPVQSILDEIKQLSDEGFKEVTLLGQNVNSYRDEQSGVNFAELMYRASLINPNMRIRFTTSHPKDISEELVHVMAERPNLCKFIHLPVQSGATTVLARMNRNHTREDYLRKIEMIRRHLPECSLSTDIITGFCGETEAEHQETLSLLKEVRYDYAFTFIYSERPNTPAAKKMVDDVPLEVKQRRLAEILDVQRQISLELYQASVGQVYEVLIEGDSKRSSAHWMGRTDTNRVVVFPKRNESIGDFVSVKILGATSATLFGERA
ncbi:MAG: tRNA (N6-isopentenyl adenosine(37)-C2)-methylthiotransferase MiaB [Chloroherpetonaceae bacterium]|nr:tRNA (N6-isopentenyl adenosine(37)-C2)-methylthiotransferase MiaB [Chloroherpetonaceae bacterium]MCS7211415.1 tRNA (N6-isopentenyl adenosine(37)-C2)-methylthiotransferase MiaB [Chloroherpetonaceae bacterium]MDW8018843.1 tRNA (N6-isopentenyl adenosine(37)-C2)-methylthiotransferase MiaB [Chloroherpetonaceae bacterium]